MSMEIGPAKESKSDIGTKGILTLSTKCMTSRQSFGNTILIFLVSVKPASMQDMIRVWLQFQTSTFIFDPP